MANARRPLTRRRKTQLAKAKTKEEKAAIAEVPAEETGRDPSTPGAPPVVFSDEDWAEFEQLCGFQATLSELAAWFAVSEDTIERRVKERYQRGFADVFKEKRSMGKTSLRRAMFANAIGGNPALQIFLAKNLLGMKDKIETSVDPESPPQQVEHSGTIQQVVQMTVVKLPANGWEPGGENYAATPEPTPEPDADREAALEKLAKVMTQPATTPPTKKRKLPPHLQKRKTTS